jgi:hypothetical protein
VEVSLEETLQEHCHHLSMHAFIPGCFSLHAHASLLVIFPPYKPTNCNSTAIVPTGFLKFSLISVQAMFVNFGLAKETGGGCYLRFDDTNPEAEKQEYVDHIQNIVSWMGWKPFKITYSSDYFQDLYELAVELIKRGRAYVDHQV